MNCVSGHHLPAHILPGVLSHVTWQRFVQFYNVTAQCPSFPLELGIYIYIYNLVYFYSQFVDRPFNPYKRNQQDALFSTNLFH